MMSNILLSSIDRGMTEDNQRPGQKTEIHELLHCSGSK